MLVFAGGVIFRPRIFPDVVVRGRYVTAQSEYHAQLAKMSFDKIFDLTAGVYFHC